MAFPARPSDWTLEIGKGYLRHIAPRPATPYGPDTSELSQVADEAWQLMLTMLVDRYDVDGWDVNPPVPLKTIWEKLAAGMLLEKWASAYGGEADERSAPARLINEAKDMIAAILSPVDDSITLVDPVTGEIILPRSSVRQVTSWSPEPKWLPEKSGQPGIGSLPAPKSAEEFFKDTLGGGDQ